MGAYAIILSVFAGAIIAAAVAATPLYVFYRFVIAEDARKAARILELETQVASQHAKGLPIADPENRVVDLPAQRPLPPEVEDFISQFDDVESQAVLRETAEAELQLHPELSGVDLRARLVMG